MGLPVATTIATQSLPGDTWRVRPIVIAGIVGASCGAHIRAFNFWQVGTADVARALLDLFGLPLILLVVMVLLLVW